MPGPFLLLLASAVIATSTVTPTAGTADAKVARGGESLLSSLTGDERFMFTLESGRTISLNPHNDFYPRYLADPKNPCASLAFAHAIETEVDGLGSNTYDLSIGARVPLVRLSEPDDLERGWQLDGELGFFARFDQTANSLDNLGWDGWYAVGVTYAPGGPVRYRVRARHLSAHVGDEFIRATGRKRINYTRDDIGGGFAWTPLAGLTAYAEGTWATNMDNEDQENPACQGGLQYERRAAFWDGRVGYYGAVDVQLSKERAWHPNTTVQAGLMLPFSNRTWRTGAQFYTGRLSYGEYFQLDETTILFGIWLDL
jgi:hypothetical protein